jgi:hypothetical protein
MENEMTNDGTDKIEDVQSEDKAIEPGGVEQQAKLTAQAADATAANEARLDDRQKKPDKEVSQADLDRLLKAYGATSMVFVRSLYEQIKHASAVKEMPEAYFVNFVVSVIHDMKPRNQAETMISAHMGLLHLMSMMSSHTVFNAQSPEQRESASRLFLKFSQTHAALYETLNRCRSSGSPQVTVQQNVSLGEGSQAAFINGPSSPDKTTSATSPVAPPAIADAKLTPMPMQGGVDKSPIPHRIKSKNRS